MIKSVELINIDRICDYIPLLSSVNNLVDLFQKCIVFPCITPSSIAQSHYYTYVQHKSFLRCTILLVPVLGNILIGIYDKIFTPGREQNSALAPANEEGEAGNGVALTEIPKNVTALKNDDPQPNFNRDLLLEAIQRQGWALAHASPELKADRDVVLLAVQNYGQALAHASPELKADKDVVLTAVQQDGRALEYASPDLKADRDVVLTAVQQDGRALEYASPDLKADIDG